MIDVNFNDPIYVKYPLRSVWAYNNVPVHYKVKANGFYIEKGVVVGGHVSEFDINLKAYRGLTSGVFLSDDNAPLVTMAKTLLPDKSAYEGNMGVLAEKVDGVNYLMSYNRYLYNYEMVGKPDIANTYLRVSPYSDLNYFFTDFRPYDATWEAQFRFKVDNIYQDFYIATGKGNTSASCFKLIISAGGHVLLMLSSRTGSNWSITNTTISDYVVLEDQWYFAKLCFTGTSYVLYMGENEQNLDNIYEIQSTDKINTSVQKNLAIGTSGFGKIDLAYTYVKFNDVIVAGSGIQTGVYQGILESGQDVSTAHTYNLYVVDDDVLLSDDVYKQQGMWCGRVIVPEHSNTHAYRIQYSTEGTVTYKGDKLISFADNSWICSSEFVLGNEFFPVAGLRVVARVCTSSGNDGKYFACFRDADLNHTHLMGYYNHRWRVSFDSAIDFGTVVDNTDYWVCYEFEGTNWTFGVMVDDGSYSSISDLPDLSSPLWTTDSGTNATSLVKCKFYVGENPISRNASWDGTIDLKEYAIYYATQSNVGEKWHNLWTPLSIV